MSDFETLYEKAFRISPTKELSDYVSCGGVGAALLSESGKIYTGICIDAHSGLGFCAEHSAIAEMLKNSESKIAEIIAVQKDGKVIAPCGRCRELISQINPANKQTVIHLSKSSSKTLSDLLPESYS